MTRELTFKYYSEKANSTEVRSSNHIFNDIYPIIKLSGEVGELHELIGKAMRDNGGYYTEETRRLAKKEMGDVLWYLNRIAHIFDTTLEDVALGNLEKIEARQRTGTTRGSGNDRENETTD